MSDSNTYSEVLLQSIQYLIDQSIQAIPQDNTKVCTIVDASKRAEGFYKVTDDGTVIYEAYADVKTYAQDESVLVLFSKDSTQKNTIISRYVSNNKNEAIKRVSPKEQYISVEKVSLNQSYGLAANSIDTTICIYDSSDAENWPNIHLCNSLYLKGDFVSLLDSYNVTDGSYGLALVGFDSEDNKILDFIFDSSMMFGNPYVFIAPFTQEILLNYNIDVPIKKLQLYFYQNKNFKYYDIDGVTKDIPLIPEVGGNSYIQNLKVSNIEIGFGYDVISVPNHTVKLFSNVSSYKNTSEDPVNIPVSLIWYNKTEDNQYLGFDQFDQLAKTPRAKILSEIKREEINSVTTYYYRLEGVSQIAISGDDNEFNINDIVLYTINENNQAIIHARTPLTEEEMEYCWIEWFATNQNGVIERIPGDTGDKTECDIPCYPLPLQTEVYAIVYYQGVGYKPLTPLILKNESTDNMLQAQLALQGTELRITHGENSEENYILYDSLTNRLFTPGEAFRARKLGLELINKPGYAVPPGLLEREGVTFIWSIPDNVMLKPIGKTDTKTLLYNISECYFAGNNNVIVRCDVSIPIGNDAIGTLSAEISIGFATYGSSGTDYTIVFKLDSDQSIQCAVLDKNGSGYDSPSIQVRWYGDKTWHSMTSPWGCSDRGLQTYNILEARAQVKYNDAWIWIYGYYNLITGKPKDFNDPIIVPSTIIYDSQGINPFYYGGEWLPKLGNWSMRYYGSETLIAEQEDIELSLAHDTSISIFSEPIELIEGAVYHITFTYDANGGEAHLITSHQELDTYEKEGYNRFHLTIKDADDTRVLWKNDHDTADNYLRQDQFIYWNNPSGLYNFVFYRKDPAEAPSELAISNFQLNRVSVNGLPYLKNNRLIVPNLYTKPTGACALELKVDDDIINIPIYIAQNQYQYQLLNEWDGKLQVNQEDNYILSSMVGAGKKNADNTFSGIVMGDYGKLDSSSIKTGLFAFDEGKQTFELNTDGTVTIGGKGIIKSDGWTQNQSDGTWTLAANKSGTLLDLTQGNLWMQGNGNHYFKFVNGELSMALKSANIKFVDQENKDISAYITSEVSNGLSAKVEKNGGKDGFSWTLEDTKFSLKSTINGTESEVFKCDKDGITVTGRINATEGRIGGWSIGQQHLYYSGENGEYTAGTSPVGVSPSEDWCFWAGGATSNDVQFKVNRAGDLLARSVTIGDPKSDQYMTYTMAEGLVIKGNITASSLSASATISASNITAGSISTTDGSITVGGWKITGDRIYDTVTSGNTTYYTIMASSWSNPTTIGPLSSSNWRFVVGPSGNYRFGITREGYLACEEAYLGSMAYIHGPYIELGGNTSGVSKAKISNVGVEYTSSSGQTKMIYWDNL